MVSHGRSASGRLVGLTCIGVIEAKRKRKNASAALDQAERYSRGFSFKTGESADGPWDAFRVPFLYATNGRPYLKQIETESGIWFRDARKASKFQFPCIMLAQGFRVDFQMLGNPVLPAPIRAQSYHLRSIRLAWPVRSHVPSISVATMGEGNRRRHCFTVNPAGSIRD